MALHLLADTTDELMWKDEDKNISSLASLNDIGNSNDVVGKFDTLEILDVLMFTVDDFSELFTVVIFLEYPLANLLFKEVREVLNVLCDDFTNGGTPRATTCKSMRLSKNGYQYQCTYQFPEPITQTLCLVEDMFK
jgi:hypothetical protein